MHEYLLFILNLSCGSAFNEVDSSSCAMVDGWLLDNLASEHPLAFVSSNLFAWLFSLPSSRYLLYALKILYIYLSLLPPVNSIAHLFNTLTAILI